MWMPPNRGSTACNWAENSAPLERFRHVLAIKGRLSEIDPMWQCIVSFLGLLALVAIPVHGDKRDQLPPPPLKVSIYSGATEYQSDQTLAGLKAYLEKNYNVRCTLNDVTDWHTLPGINQLETCDVMLVFMRRVELPPDQVEKVKKYMESGRGVVGIRTASHAFQTWLAFDREVFGGDYHNHVKDDKLARLSIPPGAKDHPVLAGVQPFVTMGKLYKNPQISLDDLVLLNARSEDDSEPVAWLRTRPEHRGQRVFYTSLGVPEDFQNENFRRLIANAILWTGRRQAGTIETNANDKK
jgi:type 1 glutamine amidotransferase